MTNHSPAAPSAAPNRRPQQGTPPSRLRFSALLELTAYLRLCPGETAGLAALLKQLEDVREDPFDRNNMRGHVTSSVLAVDLAAQVALLVLHRASGKWLPPGGHFEMSEHADGRTPTFASAARELQEETGLDRFHPMLWPRQSRILPLDVETHHIPENVRKQEGAHVHHDFLYAVLADSTRPLKPALSEVASARWFSLAETFEGRRLVRVRPKLEELLRAAQAA